MTEPAASGGGQIRVSRPAPWVALVTIDRPAKCNAFTPAMLDALAAAYVEVEHDAEVRALLLNARGDNFTGGLDLAAMSDAKRIGEPLFPGSAIDPVGLFAPRLSKPVIVAVEGICLTLGVELILASDIAICSTSARFGQIEVQRSIMAYAGATIRMVERFGWGNAMRYLLTGDQFDADTAMRLGLIQQVTAQGEAYATALKLAQTIASAAPLAVQATIANAALGQREGHSAAISELMTRARFLAGTEDAAEGVAAFREKRAPKYSGR